MILSKPGLLTAGRCLPSFNPPALGIELRFDGEALPMPFGIILCARHLDFIGWIRGGIAVLDA